MSVLEIELGLAVVEPNMLPGFFNVTRFAVKLEILVRACLPQDRRRQYGQQQRQLP